MSTALPPFSPLALVLIGSRSPVAILRLAEEQAAILSIRSNGEFNAIFDDKPNDVRVVVDYRGSLYYSVLQLHGYDPNGKNGRVWKKDGRDARVELRNKRGVAACRNAFKRIADQSGSRFAQRLTGYRDSGGQLKFI